MGRVERSIVWIFEGWKFAGKERRLKGRRRGEERRREESVAGAN